MSASMPTLFVSHGAPTLVIDNVPTRDFLLNLGKSLPRPKAILAVSAHWDTFSPRLSTHPAPHTMYDFYGFPDALYEMHYPASGAVEVAQQAAKLLEQASIPVDLDPQRGLDHGAWVPLKLMYPEADIPVAQLSIPKRTQHRAPPCPWVAPWPRCVSKVCSSWPAAMPRTTCAMFSGIRWTRPLPGMPSPLRTG